MFFFFSSRRRHTRLQGDWSSDVCSSDLSSQVCLAFVLTIGSGLLLKSFVRAWNIDPGFRVQNLYEVNFLLIGAKYNDDKVVVRAQTAVLDQVRRIPGVDSVGLTSTPPIAGGFGAFDRAGFHIQDRHIPDTQAPSVDRYTVSQDYFHTLGIPLLRGRLFTDRKSTRLNSSHLVI